MILCYHKVAPEARTDWWVSADTFYRHMAGLRFLDVVSLDDYDPGNPRHRVITFDGVYDNIHQYALPILKHFGYPFELFVIGDYIGRENTFDQHVEPPCLFADQAMLDDLAAAGGRIQWHTRTHARLPSVTGDALSSELEVPEDLQKRFPGPHFKWFAFPHGDTARAAVDEVARRFTGALACDDGDVRDRYNLPRKLVFETTRVSEARVSAIVANYNYGRFLREAVDSLERQLCPADEIVIIDDASTDDSADVLVELEGRGYRVVRNPSNLGIVENFRKAVSLTSGEYIFILGADNRVRSDFILECRALLDSAPDIAVAYTDILLFGPLSGTLATKVGADLVGCSAIEGWDVYEWRFPDADGCVPPDFATRNYVHGSSMYRRSAYDRVGGYRASEGPEDYDLFRRIWQTGGVLRHAPKPLLEYRQHSQRQTNTILMISLENMALKLRVRELQSQLKEPDLTTQPAMRLLRAARKRMSRNFRQWKRRVRAKLKGAPR